MSGNFAAGSAISAQDSVHFLGCISFQRRDRMAVGVHRQPKLAMPEDFHHHTWVNALREQ
jgi:hypothetical protein